MNSVSKTALLDRYLKLNNLTKNSDNTRINDYFDKYRTFCFDLSNDSILKGDLNFNY